MADLTSFTALNREKSGVNGVESQKWPREGHLVGKITALVAFHWKESDLNIFDREKNGVNGL